jgi:K(+)-stimulated pyrophosphate-energized sodium pump
VLALHRWADVRKEPPLETGGNRRPIGWGTEKKEGNSMDASQVGVIAAIVAGVIAIAYGLVTIQSVMKASAGDAKMQEIAAAIQEGANAYLNRQYTTIGIVGAVVAVALVLLFNIWTAIGFVVGAALSGLAGYIGMIVSVRANVRTTEASRNSLAAGLSMAFRAGAVTGMLVAGLALMGVAGYVTSSIRWWPLASAPR